MTKNIVLTLTGHDRIGIVEEVTNIFVKHGGNVENSRMTRLGGEFAMLALVALDDAKQSALEADLQKLRGEGFQVTLLATEDDHAKKYAGWLPYVIEVEGADHEGIIHEIARGLKEAGISVESMETGTVSAPVSGTPLFTMTAVVAVPPGLPEATWRASLEEAAHLSNVDVTVAREGHA
jgi:glycine cleavage system transcriptional repressor